MASPKIKHAKVPWPIVHPPGLFTSLSRGARRRHRLDVTYVVNDTTYRFQGPELLDWTDLRILQGLIALATAKLSTARILLREGRRLRPKLALSGDALLERRFAAQERRILAVRLKVSNFGQRLGYKKGGSSNKLINESIARLNKVSVVIDRPDFLGVSTVVTGYKTDPQSKELVVGLCPLLTNTILSRKNYLSVNLDEVRQLNSDAACLLHWRLHFINPGRTSQVGLEKLREYIYPAATDSTPAATTRQRNLKTREALRELNSIGWTAIEIRKGIYSISRPSKREWAPIGDRQWGISQTHEGA